MANICLFQVLKCENLPFMTVDEESLCFGLFGGKKKHAIARRNSDEHFSTRF